MNANTEAGSSNAVVATTIHSSQRGSRTASRSASRPTISRPSTPASPVARPYSHPTSLSDMERVRIRKAGENVVSE